MQIASRSIPDVEGYNGNAPFRVEVAQYFGVPLLGRTYDPLDFLMYALGVILAAALDKFVFPPTFKFWTPHESG